jgi:hypothetical protein
VIAAATQGVASIPTGAIFNSLYTVIIELNHYRIHGQSAGHRLRNTNLYGQAIEE